MPEGTAAGFVDIPSGAGGARLVISVPVPPRRAARQAGSTDIAMIRSAIMPNRKTPSLYIASHLQYSPFARLF